MILVLDANARTQSEKAGGDLARLSLDQKAAVRQRAQNALGLEKVKTCHCEKEATVDYAIVSDTADAGMFPAVTHLQGHTSGFKMTVLPMAPNAGPTNLTSGLPTTGAAVWRVPDETGLIEFLAEHLAEAGDNKNFTRKTSSRQT
ncbi:hypothetical protein B0H14DRAFT_3423855 [Mycena olivaceomarginata]|nr:hypothetical protein B0H14DRAFT_3423855 [Mycena olivaceomarginata]